MKIQTASNKVAIVTGASRGIGAEIAKLLAASGYTVVMNYLARADDANRVLREIKKDGGQAVVIQANVSVPAEASALFDQASTLFGGVDVLVNNAGIMKLSPIADTSDALFDAHVSVNLKGTFNMLRLAANRLREGGGIINISTSVVGLKLENYGIYAATKAAVESLTAILSKELRGRSITVNALAPGPTATALFMEGKSPELIEKLKNMNPMERLGTPSDIARVVSFLLSEDGAWINGQVVRANGGMV